MKGTPSFGALVLVAGCASPAASIVYLMQTDEELLRHSPVIVYGEVLGTAPASFAGTGEFGATLATDAQVRVERVLKGRVPGSVVTVRQPGGTDGRTLEILMGLPMLSEGNRVLLFLEEHENVYRTVGLGLGTFFEASHLGRRILVRHAPHLAFGHIAEERSARDSVRFRRWVADRAAGRESRVDYLATDPADHPHAIASPYIVFGKQSNHYCFSGERVEEGAPDSVAGWKKLYVTPRWRRFDTGGTLTFRVYGLQENLSADGAGQTTKVADSMAGIRAAMADWNGVAPGVSLAATWSGADLPEYPDGAADVAAIKLGDSLSPSDSPFSVGGAFLAVGCDDEVHLEVTPGSLHKIPGTEVQAAKAIAARISTFPLAASHLGSVSTATGKANDFTELMLHELGHALGLDHSYEAGAIMSPSMDFNGVNPGLGTDDVNGIKYLYPLTPPPPSFGGGAPPPEPEPEPEPEPPPPPVPPVASFTVDLPCEDGLCSARTGEDVTFTDTSSGNVARRSWDFESTGRTPSAKSVSHHWPSPGFYRATLTVEGAGVESTASRTFRVDAAEPAGICAPGPKTACLQDSRYEVTVDWQHPDGELNAARVVRAGTNDSGLFSFFDGDNWEMLVKVLNGCSINGHYWVYAASATDLGYTIRVTDTAAGETREFHNETGQTAWAVVEPEAFSSDCEPPSARTGWSALAGGKTLLLDDGRFEAEIEWSSAEDRGVARTVRRGTEDSGLFWFFDPGNWEVLVKVLDGCGVNGHYWVYTASATSLPFEMSITDTETGEVYHYAKGPDELSALADPAAFPNSCQAGR